MVVKKKVGKKGRTVSVDFEGVEAGGRSCPDGTYSAEITSVDEEESQAGNDMLVAKWKILDGKGKGAVIWDNLSLTPQALWRFKGLLEALEVEVPDSAMDIDLDDLVGQTCTIEITNEPYEGKQRPRVTGYGGAAEEEEEKPAAKKKTSKKAEAEDEPEEEEDPPARNKKTSAKPKFKEGAKVTFEDEDGKTVKASIVEIDGDEATVEDKNGDQYQLDVSDLEAA
jgi:hypothetical protein